MTIDVNGALSIVNELSEERDVKVCFKSSVKGGVATGATATLGGVILGPLGLAIGGTLGGLLSYFAFKGSFKSVPEVVNEMSPEQKKQLADKIFAVLNQLDMTDLVYAGSILATSTNVQDMVMKEIVSHLTDSMKMNVIC